MSEPHLIAKFGWDRQTLRNVARWANRRIWRYAIFDEYRGGVKTDRQLPTGHDDLFALSSAGGGAG